MTNQLTPVSTDNFGNPNAWQDRQGNYWMKNQQGYYQVDQNGNPINTQVANTGFNGGMTNTNTGGNSRFICVAKDNFGNEMAWQDTVTNKLYMKDASGNPIEVDQNGNPISQNVGFNPINASGSTGNGFGAVKETNNVMSFGNSNPLHSISASTTESKEYRPRSKRKRSKHEGFTAPVVKEQVKSVDIPLTYECITGSNIIPYYDERTEECTISIDDSAKTFNFIITKKG